MFEMKKRVYCFGGKTAEGDGSMRELLGGKGANLAEMSKLGMPVPQDSQSRPSAAQNTTSSVADIPTSLRQKSRPLSRLPRSRWAKNSVILTILFL